MMAINVSTVNSTLFSFDRDRRLKVLYSSTVSKYIAINVVFLS